MAEQQPKKLPKRKGEIIGDRKVNAGIEALINYLNQQTTRVSVKQLIEAAEISASSDIGNFPIGFST